MSHKKRKKKNKNKKKGQRSISRRVVDTLFACLFLKFLEIIWDIIVDAIKETDIAQYLFFLFKKIFELLHL